MDDKEIISEILKKARWKSGYPIERVTEETGISAVYLQKMEDNLLKTYSASVLYKLSGLYDIELKPLLELAGCIVPKK